MCHREICKKRIWFFIYFSIIKFSKNEKWKTQLKLKFYEKRSYRSRCPLSPKPPPPSSYTHLPSSNFKILSKRIVRSIDSSIDTTPLNIVFIETLCGRWSFNNSTRHLWFNIYIQVRYILRFFCKNSRLYTVQKNEFSVKKLIFLMNITVLIWRPFLGMFLIDETSHWPWSLAYRFHLGVLHV